MKLSKLLAAAAAAAIAIGSLSTVVSAEVGTDGTYKKGIQWYFSDEQQFDFSGAVKYDENGQPISSTEGMAFLEESPAAIYQQGVTDYTINITNGKNTVTLPCKIVVRGDIDRNDVHNIFDSVLIARYTVGHYEITDDFTAFCADADKNGVVDIFDAAYIARLALKELEEEQRIERERIAAMKSRVVELVNIERQKVGSKAVVMSEELNSAADIRAKEISRHWSHERPDGSSCFTVLDKKKIEYIYAGENLGTGYETPEEVVEGWMNSDSHRENMLSPNYNKIGIGYYYDDRTESIYFWSQFFTD